MKEYLDFWHMTSVEDDLDSNTNSCYLCHHGVYKEQITTTKLGVVFDGSYPTSSGGFIPFYFQYNSNRFVC